MRNKRKMYAYKLSMWHRLIAVVLSILLIVSILPAGAMAQATAATTELSFIITDKQGSGISDIVVTLIGTNGEEDVVSEPSGEDGVALFLTDMPIVGSYYTYTIDTKSYIPVEENTPILIEADSEPIEITLYAPAPTGEIIPVDPELTYGDTVTLEVWAEGIGDLSYQWYKDGNILDGETTETFTIETVLLETAGTYSCEVTSDLSDTDVHLLCESVLNVLKATPRLSIQANPESGAPYAEAGIILTAEASHHFNDTVSKPTGEVTFYVDGMSVGTAMLNDGTADLPAVMVTSGKPHEIYAEYSPGNDPNYMDAVTEPISYEVGKISPEEGVHYTQNAPNGQAGWYKGGGALEIHPMGPFDQIREGEDGDWKSELIKDEETPASGTDVTFYLKDSKTGEISNPHTVSYRLDKTEPEDSKANPKWVKGQSGQKEWDREYLGDMYGDGIRNIDNFLYYVNLTATDTLSEIAYFQWEYKDSGSYSEPILATDGMAQIGVNYNQWYAYGGITVKAYDKAGNVSQVSASAQNSLAVTYDAGALQRYVDSDDKDVTEENLEGDTRFIYNQETAVTLTVQGHNFDESPITVSINDEPQTMDWKAEATGWVGVLRLPEGDSVVKISAAGYDILTHESGSRVVKDAYTSNIHTVDTTKPVLTVAFDRDDAGFAGERNATVSVTDKNFRAEEFFFSALTAKDIQGNDISGLDADAFGDMLKNAAWERSGDTHSAVITFSEEAHYSFTLEYKDLANNTAEPYVAMPFTVDKTAPDNLKITYITKPVSTVDGEGTIGYYKPTVTIQVSAEDDGTGIDHFNWTYVREGGSGESGQAPWKSAQIDCTDSAHFTYINQNKTAVGTFTLTADELVQYRGSIFFTATDKAGRTSAVHYGDGIAIDEKGNQYETGKNHVVVVDTIAPQRQITYPNPKRIRDKNTLAVFTGDTQDRVNQEDTHSIVYYDDTCGAFVPVTLKITETNFNGEDVKVKVNDSPYTIDDWRKEGDVWTGTIKLEHDGAYVITVDYTDRSGNRMKPYKSEQIVIDRNKPVIEKFEFIPDATEGTVEAASFLETLEYGYYFKTDFAVEVHVSDTAPTSALESVVYRLVPYENGVKQEEISGSLPVINGVAKITVPGGFKGQIFAEAYDYTGNKSEEVTPQAIVVDKAAPTVEIVHNGTTSYVDGAGNPLHVTDTSVTVTITDTVSGIAEIGYAQSAEKAPVDRKSIILDNTGYHLGDNLGDGWMVSEMDVNLITKVTKTFSYTSDDNDIRLTFDATDRSGNRTEGISSGTFTVDKTAPVINVAFREDDDTDVYYEADRIADITVIERNFDASLIKTEIENTFGSVPGLTFIEVSNTEHTAVIVFDEGDYTFKMSGTDLGDQPAIVNYSGGNENLFYVDKTKPAVTDNFGEFSKNETDNSFNEDKTVSISITEHNFDFNLTKLRVLRKEAGSAHSTAGLVDVTQELISVADWVSDGDVHTIAFPISADAVYQVEIAPADLAGNEADARNTVVFEIDKTAPVVSARNGGFVSDADVTFLDVYTYERKDEPAPTIEFSDPNIAYLKYELMTWRAEDTKEDQVPVIKPDKVYLEEDTEKKGIIEGGIFTLPDFTKDGIYALELIAVDRAGNESVPNINTYVRLVKQDVLAFIQNSNLADKTGLYSFQYEDGTPISMRPDRFRDINVFAIAKDEANTDIVLRNTNAEEMSTNAQAVMDNSVYGVTMYNFVLKSGFFTDNFSGDTDMDLHLSVKSDDKRIDLGKIHIDNIAPTCVLPGDFNSWRWYFGEAARTISISAISELLDEGNCRVYDNGREIDFIYSSSDNTLSFTLEKGWHNVGVVLADMAGNENNIQEKVNLHVGYFWTWIIAAASFLVCCAITLALIHRRKKKQLLGNE